MARYIIGLLLPVILLVSSAASAASAAQAPLSGHLVGERVVLTTRDGTNVSGRVESVTTDAITIAPVSEVRVGRAVRTRFGDPTTVLVAEIDRVVDARSGRELYRMDGPLNLSTGRRVWVTTTDGRQHAGRLLRTDLLGVYLEDNDTGPLAYGTIRTIEARGPVWRGVRKGMLWGAIAGAGFGLLTLASSEDCAGCEAAIAVTAFTAGLGTGIGAMVGAGIGRGRDLVYASPQPAPVPAGLSIAPAGAGVRVALAW